MTAFETTKAKIEGLTANKGHVRLFLLASAIWVALSLIVVWGPLPTPPTVDYGRFTFGVAACQRAANYDQCVVWENNHLATKAVMGRLMVLLALPIGLPLLFIGGLFISEWIREGYANTPPKA